MPPSLFRLAKSQVQIGLIRDKTDKVLAFETRNKQCGTCNTSERLKRRPRNHDCRKNWQGTAKAMESDMVVSMLQKQEEKTFCIDKLALDHDSTAAAAMKPKFCANGEKMGNCFQDWDHRVLFSLKTNIINRK